MESLIPGKDWDIQKPVLLGEHICGYSFSLDKNFFNILAFWIILLIDRPLQNLVWTKYIKALSVDQTNNFQNLPRNELRS